MIEEAYQEPHLLHPPVNEDVGFDCFLCFTFSVSLPVDPLMDVTSSCIIPLQKPHKLSAASAPKSVFPDVFL